MKPAKELLAELEEKGFLFSVFYRGAFCWGLPFGLLFSLTISFFERKSLIAATLQILPLALILGAVFGWGLWGVALLQGVKRRQDND
ncbi:hypothetical protein R6242_06405 [Iodobacter sp. CM08]|uniref:hypothetical protein n=1 Tax=Iodobacter sp. CM08 TaxID=3085902 RepID=UPI00298172A6|nr:hypothetical protein [Iodobacter sp. CM08]MDW5416203.1 hypothetical protein [Iodobacter sp. CM08]